MTFLVPFHGGLMIIQCPSCQSIRIAALHNGRRVCGSVGTAAGAASGVAAATSGARVGMTLGYVAGPGGSLLGGIAGAVIGGLIGEWLAERQVPLSVTSSTKPFSTTCNAWIVATPFDSTLINPYFAFPPFTAYQSPPCAGFYAPLEA